MMLRISRTPPSSRVGERNARHRPVPKAKGPETRVAHRVTTPSTDSVASHERHRIAVGDERIPPLPRPLASGAGHGDGDDRLHDRLHLGDDDPGGSPSLGDGGAVDWSPPTRSRPRPSSRSAAGSGDILGHKRIVAIGDHRVRRRLAAVRAGPRQLGIAEPWLIVFRVAPGHRRRAADPVGDGAGARTRSRPTERGKGLAIFFIVAGLFTAIGPIAGSYLTQYWTWRAIFWINVPVALLSLIEFALGQAERRQATRRRVDWRGAGARSSSAWALTVLGHPAVDRMGLGRPATIGSIVVGVIVLVAFVRGRAQDREPADRRQRDARQPAVRGRQPADASSSSTAWLAVFFFGSDVLPDRGRPGTDRRPASRS